MGLCSATEWLSLPSPWKFWIEAEDHVIWMVKRSDEFLRFYVFFLEMSSCLFRAAMASPQFNESAIVGFRNALLCRFLWIHKSWRVDRTFSLCVCMETSVCLLQIWWSRLFRRKDIRWKSWHFWWQWRLSSVPIHWCEDSFLIASKTPSYSQIFCCYAITSWWRIRSHL